jgi:predicted nucleotidyltransferase
MLNPDYKEVLSIFIDQKVEFLVVGAYAMAVHGFPRATGDIDFFINSTPENSEKVFKSLAIFGAPVSQLSKHEFTVPGTVFQIGVPPRRIDILTKIDGVIFEECFKECKHISIEGLSLPVISLTKLILNKESTGRTKDSEDVKQLKSLL